MQNRTTNCGAIQMSDQMCCAKCGLAWDMNDRYPPECGLPNGMRRDRQDQVSRVTGISPYGYSIFVRHLDFIAVTIGWANSPEQMVSLTLQALGFNGRRTPPSGMEIVVYREPDIDSMAFISRQRLAFTMPECVRAHGLLEQGEQQTTIWENVKIVSALTLRRQLEAIA